MRNLLSDFNANPEVLKNYSLLKELGLWDKLNILNKQITSLEELIEEAIDIFGKRETNEVIDYIITKILDRFIPSFLAFVLKENVHSDSLDIICFENMKQVEGLFILDKLEAFDLFFHNKPHIIEFKALESGIGNPCITDPLKVLRPVFVIPIIGIDELYGFIVVGEKVLGQQYTEQEMEYFIKLIRFMSISFQNNIHYISAITDPKTGAFSHSYFKNRLEEEYARIKRHNHEAILLMIDIDYFKKLNDTHGHLAGDVVLQTMVSLLQRNLRTVDLVSRFGGEEFTVLLVETGIEAGIRAAERIRESIESFTFVYENRELRITISCGLRHITRESTESVEDLLTQADVALYKAKAGGRNRTECYKRGE